LSRVLSLDAEKANEIVKGAGFNITEQAELHFWPARIILSYMEWPWIVTAPICWLGEMLLSAAPTALHLGDYKAIGARRM
jgi:hypothetical protein